MYIKKNNNNKKMFKQDRATPPPQQLECMAINKVYKVKENTFNSLI
jgi:hypothetical protein